MSKAEPISDDWVKPSRAKQWQEKSGKPVMTQSMSRAKIEEFKSALVASYQCEPDHITYEFQKIKDEHDEDRDDCLLLIYKLKGETLEGVPFIKEVFSMKVPLPDELKKVAMQRQQQRAAKEASNQNRNLLPAPAASPAVPAQVSSTTQQVNKPTITPIVSPAAPAVSAESRAKPVLRKPVRGKK